MDVAFATDSVTAGALTSAFPQLDLSAFGFGAPAPLTGAGGGLAEVGGAGYTDSGEATMYEEDEGLAVVPEDDGVSRGLSYFQESDVPSGASGLADADQLPLGPHGMPSQSTVYLGAEDHADGAPEGEEDSVLHHGTAVTGALPPAPGPVVVPELPAEGACLRATHLRSEMPSDAGLDAVQTACRGLGHVVSDVTSSATVLCTALDGATGAPVDYSVQVFTQVGCGDLVMEVQHAGRGDRLAFNAIYASVAEQLRAEAGCGGSLELPRLAAAQFEPLGPPRALSARAATLGAASSPSAAFADAAPALADGRAASADATVPGEAGLTLLADRLESASRSRPGSPGRQSPAPDASESAETLAAISDRLAAMDESALAGTCAALDAARVPRALVGVLVAATAAAEADDAATAAMAADDSTVIPSLVALGRLLACPGRGCETLTAAGPAALAALSALSDAAKAASLQHGDALRDLAAAAAPSSAGSAGHSQLLAAFASLDITDTSLSGGSAPPPPAPHGGSCGDGPAASSSPWLAASGAVLRLRATASALRSASSREGPAPDGSSPSGKTGVSWAAVVAEAAGDGIAALVRAAADLHDDELSASVNWLQTAGRR